MTLAVLPPFTPDTATARVRQAEDAWNLRDAARIARACAPDSRWRNRTEFVTGRPGILAFLTRKWTHERDYRLIKELWAADGARLAVRFAYEWQDGFGNWYRSFGNETWEFDRAGLLSRRIASTNDMAIAETDRLLRWPEGPRPPGHPGLSDIGL
jgi:hypothetical protein